ncbi:nad(+) nadh kinase domain-containing protein [Cystoisospora suis]|uniref:Nad(+) nadh kinase domain-containing protein n=1 Tax=Cystoisospora suis TaxID=483139 RepID=A0A2C6KM86_9APIC|nr:nad(+) nadh kinase domain-containing protein [Cystoisospora suis]
MHHVLGLTVIVEPSAAKEMAVAVNNRVPLKTWDFHLSNPESGVSSSSSLTSTSQSRRHSPQFSSGHRYRRTSPSSSPSSSTSSSTSSSSTLSSPSASFCSPPLSSHLHDSTADPRGRDRKQPPSSSCKIGSLSSSKRSSYQRLPGQLCESIDVVVALGGDGTMLWVSRLFEESVPPVLGVSMGSLGYLTRFPIDEAREQLTEMAARKKFSVNLRCRLKVCLVTESHEVRQTLVAFNECVIDRGHSSNLCSLDVYCNDCFFTTVAADGLILATPTGSTAYSMSAGGSMVHPKVPCILFTPICPHSLSFRPLILPDSVVLRIVVPEDSRGSVWIAVDGRSRTQVKRGMYVLVSLSAFPFPMVVRRSSSCQDTWLESLKKGLNWNLRVRQGGRGDREDRFLSEQRGPEEQEGEILQEATTVHHHSEQEEEEEIEDEDDDECQHRHHDDDEGESDRRPSSSPTSSTYPLRNVADLRAVPSMRSTCTDSLFTHNVSPLSVSLSKRDDGHAMAESAPAQASYRPAAMESFPPCMRHVKEAGASFEGGPVEQRQGEENSAVFECAGLPCVAERQRQSRLLEARDDIISGESPVDDWSSSFPVSCGSSPFSRQEEGLRSFAAPAVLASRRDEGSSLSLSPVSAFSSPESVGRYHKETASTKRCTIEKHGFPGRRTGDPGFSSLSVSLEHDGQRREKERHPVRSEDHQEDMECTRSAPCSSSSSFPPPARTSYPVSSASVHTTSSVLPTSSSVGHHPGCRASRPEGSTTSSRGMALSTLSSSSSQEMTKPLPGVHKELSPEFVKGPVFMVSSLQSCTSSLPSSNDFPPVRFSSVGGGYRGGRRRRRQGRREDSFTPDREAPLSPRRDFISFHGRHEGRGDGDRSADARKDLSHVLNQDKETSYISVEETDNGSIKELSSSSLSSSPARGRHSSMSQETRDERPLGQGPPICPCCSRASRYGLSLAEWGKHQVGHHRVHRVVSYGEDGQRSEEGKADVGSEAISEKQDALRGRERSRRETTGVDGWRGANDCSFPLVRRSHTSGSEPIQSRRQEEVSIPPTFLSCAVDEKEGVTRRQKGKVAEQPPCSCPRREDKYRLSDEGDLGVFSLRKRCAGVESTKRDCRSDGGELRRVVDARSPRASSGTPSVADSLSQQTRGERSFFSAVSGDARSEPESKEFDSRRRPFESFPSPSRRGKGEDTAVQRRGSRIVDLKDCSRTTDGEVRPHVAQTKGDWGDQVEHYRDDEQADQTGYRSGGSNERPRSYDGKSSRVSPVSSGLARQVQRSSHREEAKGEEHQKVDELTSRGVEALPGLRTEERGTRDSSLDLSHGSGPASFLLLSSSPPPEGTVDTPTRGAKAPEWQYSDSHTVESHTRSGPSFERANNILSQARCKTGVSSSPESSHEGTLSEDVSQSPLLSGGRGEDEQFHKSCFCPGPFPPRAQHSPEGDCSLVEVLPSRAASAPPARLEINPAHSCPDIPRVQVSAGESPFRGDRAAAEGTGTISPVSSWGGSTSPLLRQSSSSRHRRFSGPPSGERGSVNSSSRQCDRMQYAGLSCPSGRRSPCLCSSSACVPQNAVSRAQGTRSGKACPRAVGSGRTRYTQAIQKKNEGDGNRNVSYAPQANIGSSTGLPCPSPWGVRRRTESDGFPVETARENRDCGTSRKGTPKRRLPRCSFSTGALASVLNGSLGSLPSAGAVGADEGSGGNTGRPGSMRPSSSTGEIQRTGGGGSSRTSGGNQSVFILPTDECETMVRLVSRSSRSSSDLFRNVQDVAVSGVSPSPPSVTPRDVVEGSVAASPAFSQQGVSTAPERERRSRSSPLQAPYSWPAPVPSLVTIEGESLEKGECK